MDADAVVAAMCSPGGASAALLRAARESRVTLLATAPLCIEYESVCSRPKHVEAADFSSADFAVFLMPWWIWWGRSRLGSCGGPSCATLAAS